MFECLGLQSWTGNLQLITVACFSESDTWRNPRVTIQFSLQYTSLMFFYLCVVFGGVFVLFLLLASPCLSTHIGNPKLLRPWNSTTLLCPDSKKSVELFGLISLMSCRFFPFCFIFLWIGAPIHRSLWGMERVRLNTETFQKKKKNLRREKLIWVNWYFTNGLGKG